MKIILALLALCGLAFAQPPTRFLEGTAAAPSGSCDAAAEVGGFYLQTGNPASVATRMSRCVQTGASTYGWMPVAYNVGTTAPATCAVGETFFDSDATAGSNWFGCTSADTWTLLSGGGGGSGDAASAVTTTCSGATPTFTATSNTINRFDCGLVATNVTSSTLASLTSGALYTIVITQPGGGGITFAAITGLTGFLPITAGNGDAADEVCMVLFTATGATTGRVDSQRCDGGTPGVSIPGSTSGVGKVVAPATGGVLSTLPSTAGVLSVVIASGTKALDTDEIASEACDSMTFTATGTASTDTIQWSFNADVTGVTGYAPSPDGGLILYLWPTTDTVNIKVCNPTADPITPGAVVTLNLRVTR